MHVSLCPACVCGQPWLLGSGNLGPILLHHLVIQVRGRPQELHGFGLSFRLAECRLCRYREINNNLVLYIPYISIWATISVLNLYSCTTPRALYCTVA